MNNPVRAALIGPGTIAVAHVEAVRHAGERIDLTAIVGPDQDQVEAFRARHAIPHAYTSTTEMLSRERPDLVLICTPPAVHRDLAIECLEAGAWVYCEKPLCASLAELDSIEAAEARTGCRVSTVLQWRSGSAAHHLRQLIAEQAMGRFLLGVCETLWYRDLSYYQAPWRGTWACELGGTTMAHGTHLIDLMLWLLGENWEEVQAMIGTLDRPIEVENIAMAMVRFASGAMANITTSALSARQESRLRLDFQRATVEVNALYSYTNANWRYSLPEGSRDTEALGRWQTPPTDRPGNHISQLNALLDCMERGENPLASGPESRRVLEFITSLYKSAFTRQPVLRGSITPEDNFYHAMNGIPRR